MASATRVDGIVAFANAGENLQPAATAAVEARPQGNADARPALAADVVACWARALSIDPWMSLVVRLAVAFAARVAVAGTGCVAGRGAVVVVTRRGAGGVGNASRATGAAIAAAGRLVCWRSIDGWLLPDAGGRLGCSIDGWLLCSPITDVSPGAARKLRSLINATACVQCFNQCVAPSLRGQPRLPESSPRLFGLDRPQPHTAVQTAPRGLRGVQGRTSFKRSFVRGELFDQELLVI